VERYGKEMEAGKQYSVDLALNQTDLASMVGARREWVNRLLSDWRKRGLLEYDRGVLTILDMERVVAERDSRIELFSNESDW
jgi:CRP/FNR family cyclic AMP-dependent transcriptional regulator